MRTVKLGKTDIEVSELCLGTMTWGTQNTMEEGHAQIDMALDHGVNFMDTAEVYPVNPVRTETVGRTEEIIGEWFAKTGRRNDFVVATKIGGVDSAAREGEPISRDAITRAVESSLKRLKTDVIDIYQFHWPNRPFYHFRRLWTYDPSTQDKAATLAHMEEALDTLQGLVQQGKIRHFGLSNETAWGTAQWLKLAEQGKGPRVETIQNEYSLLCRYYDTDLAELGVNEQVTLLAYSPLAVGLLTGKYDEQTTPSGSRRSLSPDLGGRVKPRVWSALAAYVQIARDHGLDPAQMALAFTLDRPFPIVPIIGATSTEQLATALGSVDVTLSEEVKAAIAEAYMMHPMPF